MTRLVIHARLTKSCLADCAYCSSGGRAAAPPMPADQFVSALAFATQAVAAAAAAADAPAVDSANQSPPSTPVAEGRSVSVQYVGGEILSLPSPDLRATVLAARRALGSHFSQVDDGAQSNLIASPERVLRLHDLFGPRISTSIDRRGGARTLGGDPERYRAAAQAGRELLHRRRGLRPSVIFVVDRPGLAQVLAEAAAAEQDGCDLTLRAVFQGAKGIEAPTPDELAAVYAEAFDRWFMRATTRLFPHAQLLSARLPAFGGSAAGAAAMHGCPFQADCARHSIDIESDGTLHLCLDMADAGLMPLGNALTGVFDRATWSALDARRTTPPTGCASCPWWTECRGGCLSEALAAGRGIHGQTPLCPVWMALFSRIDAGLSRFGAPAVQDWFGRLGDAHTRSPK